MLQIKLIYLWNMTMPEFSLFKLLCTTGLSTMLTCTGLRRDVQSHYFERKSLCYIIAQTQQILRQTLRRVSLFLYNKTLEALSSDFLCLGMSFCSKLACFHLIWLSHTLDWFWEGGKKKIKSTRSNEYGSMPRILSAALNGLGLDTVQAGQWLLLYTMGCIQRMHSQGSFFFHTAE